MPTRRPLDEKLVAFFYDLMRDHLPVGVVRRVVSDSIHDATSGVRAIEPLCQLARDLVSEFREEPEEDHA